MTIPNIGDSLEEVIQFRSNIDQFCPSLADFSLFNHGMPSHAIMIYCKGHVFCHPGLWKLKKLWGCQRVESTELFALDLIFAHSRKLTYVAGTHLPFWWFLFKDSWWSCMYSVWDVWVLSMARLVYQRVYIYHTTGIFLREDFLLPVVDSPRPFWITCSPFS